MGRPPKYKTAEELEEAIDKYFKLCTKTDEPYTMPGLALGLGFIDRHAILNYKGKSKEFDAAIKRAKTTIEAQRVAKMLKGGQNIAGCIFDLKNNADYKDKTETEVSGPGGGPIAIAAYPPNPDTIALWEQQVIAARDKLKIPEKT